MFSHPRRFALFCLIFTLLTLSISPILAQTNTPIMIGENKLGEVTDTNPGPTFQYNAATAETVLVQALAVSNGFAPQVIISLNNVPVHTIANPDGAAVAEDNVELTSPGLYIFQVQTANGAPGQFVLSLQEGQEDLPPPLPLIANQSTRVDVNADTPKARYAFNASPTANLILEIAKTTNIGGAMVSVEDAQSGDLLAMFGSSLDGDLMIPPGTTNFIIMVEYSGENLVEDATLLLRTGEAAPSPQVTPTIAPPPTQAPPPTPANTGNQPCTISPEGNDLVNVRQTTSLQAPIIAKLQPNSQTPVIGIVQGGSWYQVNLGGFVAAFVVDLSGNCGGLPIVIPPPTPTPQATPDNNPDGDAWDNDTDQCPTIPGTVDGCPDLDGDAIKDSEDLCPTLGGPESNNGCPPNATPDPDTDGDTYPDAVDACPNEAGIAPSGCPDTDGDGYADDVDTCPNDAGDPPDGCPAAVDTDGDGYLDADDVCPNESGIAPTGCPDPDSDGFPNDLDTCPNEAGIAPDGCPPPPDADNDGIPNEDDTDDDNDGIPDDIDKCPLVDHGGVNQDPPCYVLDPGILIPLLDTDGDGYLDVFDACPNDPGGPPNGCPFVINPGLILTIDPNLIIPVDPIGP